MRLDFLNLVCKHLNVKNVFIDRDFLWILLGLVWFDFDIEVFSSGQNSHRNLIIKCQTSYKQKVSFFLCIHTMTCLDFSIDIKPLRCIKVLPLS